MDIRRFLEQKQKKESAAQKRTPDESSKALDSTPSKVHSTTASISFPTTASSFTVSENPTPHHSHSSEGSLSPCTTETRTGSSRLDFCQPSSSFHPIKEPVVSTLCQSSTSPTDIIFESDNPKISDFTASRAEELRSLSATLSFDLGDCLNHSLSEEVKYQLLTELK